MARFLAFVFFVAASVQLYFDWSATQGYLGRAFEFAEIGAVWVGYDYYSFEFVQATVIDLVSRDFWENTVFPVFMWPLVPTFYVLSVLFWIIRRRKPRIERKKSGPKSKKDEISSGPVRRMR